MANRRCIDKSVVSSMRFLKMGKAAQALYMHLVIETDDEGVAEAGTVLRITQTRKSAFTELIDNGFITVIDPVDNVVYINGWQSFNTPDKRYARNSSYHDTLIDFFPDITFPVFEGKTAPKTMSDTRRSEVKGREMKGSEVSTNSDTNYTTTFSNSSSDFSDDRMKSDFNVFKAYCLEQCFPLSAINPSTLYNKLVRNEWKTASGKPIADVKGYLDYCYNLACQKNPSVESERQQLMKKRKEEAERQEAEQKRIQAGYISSPSEDELTELMADFIWKHYDEMEIQEEASEIWVNVNRREEQSRWMFLPEDAELTTHNGRRCLHTLSNYYYADGTSEPDEKQQAFLDQLQ